MRCGLKWQRGRVDGMGVTCKTGMEVASFQWL